MKAVLPDALRREVEQLQDAFGAVMDQAIMLTDQDGNRITQPALPSRLYKIIIEMHGIVSPFDPALLRMGSLSFQTVTREWIPGLKYMVTELSADDGRRYQLWCGLFMEAGARPQALEALADKFRSHPDYALMSSELAGMKELEPKDMTELRDKTAVLARIIGRLLPGNPATGEGRIRREEECRQGLRALGEAARLLPLASTAQRLGGLLLDLVVGLPCRETSALVYLAGQPPADRYYSRGWAPGLQQLYTSDLEARYSPEAFLSSAILNRASGSLLLECPLIAEGVFKGVLVVGFRQPEEAEEWRTCLEALAAMAGPVLLLLEKKQEYNRQSAAILTVLQECLRSVNAELQQVALDASGLAFDFARYLGYSGEQAGILRQAALLAPYRTSYLDTLGFYKDESALLKQIDRLCANDGSDAKPALSHQAQALALVLAHIGGNADQEIFIRGLRGYLVEVSRFCLDADAVDGIGAEPRAAFGALVQQRAESQPERRANTTAGLIGSAALKSPKEEWGISPREEEVLELIVQGKTNKEIAGALFISEHTVKNHLSRIFTKMNVTDRSQIIALVYKRILNSERIKV
ncbi:response regulator transcription factor [Paenibacillus tepidiphilus]|uniref:response regulator transcription factor n=1 Tax=Paenibacillus tepidiphilus TaxID=2608683 RepID=UPI0023AF1E15|nr:helix-turn-helix transcriptional regulator [Paenibacillus tepidiphilus]